MPKLCVASDRLGQDGGAIDWSSAARPNCDAQGGLIGCHRVLISPDWNGINKIQKMHIDAMLYVLNLVDIR